MIILSWQLCCCYNTGCLQPAAQLAVNHHRCSLKLVWLNWVGKNPHVTKDRWGCRILLSHYSPHKDVAECGSLFKPYCVASIHLSPKNCGDRAKCKNRSERGREEGITSICTVGVYSPVLSINCCTCMLVWRHADSVQTVFAPGLPGKKIHFPLVKLLEVRKPPVNLLQSHEKKRKKVAMVNMKTNTHWILHPGISTNEAGCAPDTTSHAILPSNEILHGQWFQWMACAICQSLMTTVCGQFPMRNWEKTAIISTTYSPSDRSDSETCNQLLVTQHLHCFALYVNYRVLFESEINM